MAFRPAGAISLSIWARALSVTGNYGNELYDVSRDDLRDSWLNKAGVLFDWTLGASTIARVRATVSSISRRPPAPAGRTCSLPYWSPGSSQSWGRDG